MLPFLTEHALIIYVQYIKGSKRKTSKLLENLVEKDLDNILNALNFAPHFQRPFRTKKIKIKNCSLDDCVFQRIRLIHGNQLLPNIKRNK